MGRAFSFGIGFSRKARPSDRSQMDEFKFFKTFKERGEWIEMRFMAEAMRHGYKVLLPWGDSQPFDVAIIFGSRVVRVQVKSTTCRAGTGYHCEFERSSPKASYTL